MELKDVVGVGQAGLTAVLDEVSKLRDSHADDASVQEREIEAAQRDESSDEAGSDSESKGIEVKELMASVATLAAPAMARAVPGAVRKSGKGLMMVALVGAAAGAGYLIWKRRKAAVNAELSGESLFVAPESRSWDAAFQPGAADVDSPDVVDEQFARDIDAVAAELAEDIVESIEVPDSLADEAEAVAVESGEFQAGVADVDSPDVVDEQFAKEVDAVADELAEDIVQGVEEPRS